MYRNEFPEVVLPGFVPSVEPSSGFSIADVTQLLRGEDAASVVVNGIEQLPLSVIDAADEVTLQMLVVLQPGRSGVPQLLEKVQIEASMRPGCEVRVMASPWGERHHDLVMLTRGSVEHGARLRLAFGTGDPTNAATSGCQVALEPSVTVAFHAQGWFEQLWAPAPPLTSKVAAAYPEWQRSSTSRFADEWDVYRRTLQDFALAETPDGAEDEAEDLGLPRRAGDELFVVDDLTEEPVGDGPDYVERLEDVEQSSSVVAVRRPSELDGEIAALYARGELVTLHRSEKLPTYELDVTESLGLPLRSRSGRASARSPIRLDLLPGQGRDTVNMLRGEAGRILSRHAFRMAENQHWMLLGVKPEFAKRLAAMEVVDELHELLGADVSDYVAQEMDSFVASLRKVLHDRKIEIDISDRVRLNLSAAICRHLNDVANVNAKATYSAEGLTFSSGQSTPYARPFGLLVAAGIATRDRINNAGSGAKRETEAPSLSALDVVGGDGLLHQETSWEVARIARSQLAKFKAIRDGGASERACCRLLELMRSDSE